MATKLPRLNVAVEPSLFRTIQKLSKREGLSMSLIVRDLVREALAIHEDVFWAREAAAREKTSVRSKAKSHTEVWRSQNR